MEINSDFSQRVVLHTDEIEWVETRMKGVKRRMLDRIGAESGHATSIVSYEPNSKFASHVHTGGEEFIVLEGVFQDEHGDYPVGSYVRNPPQSRHTPGSDEGTLIFVKLWQFDPEDRAHVRVRFDKTSAIAEAGREGVAVVPLYHDERETVRIEHWAAGADVEISETDGIEVLVLDGGFSNAGDTLHKHSWLRIPVGSKLNAVAGPQGACVWIKSGHLKHAHKKGHAA